MSKTVQAEKPKAKSFSMRLGTVCKELANSLAAIKLNGDEALWSVTSDGLYHASMDPSHVQLVEVRATPRTITIEGDSKFCTNVSDLLKVLNRADADDKLQISMEPKPAEKPADYRPSIHLVLKNDRRKLEYDVYLVDHTSTAAPLPNMEPQVTIGVKTSTLQEALGDMAVLSEYATLDTNLAKRTVTFRGDSDSGKASRTLGKNDGMTVEPLGSNTQPVISKYDIERTSKYLKVLKTEEVTLEYASAKPLKIVSRSGGVITTFYLAPRAQS